MSDNWQPGDLALCVRNTDPVLGSTKRVMPGRIYTVEFPYWSSKGDGLGLMLVGVRSAMNCGFHAFLFRKIKPLTDEEREEFLRELNTPARETA